MCKRLSLLVVVLGILLVGFGLDRSLRPAWAATPVEKLAALNTLVNHAQQAMSRADKWVRRVQTIFESPEIKDDLTATQKANLVATWTEIRNEALAAVEVLPENLATWEPPEEPEEE